MIHSHELSDETTAALIGLMNEHHGRMDQALRRPLADWADWLESEGYGTNGVTSFFQDAELLQQWKGETTLWALYAKAIAQKLSTEEFLDDLREREPDYLKNALATADQILANNEALLTLAGGTGHGLNRTGLTSVGKWGIRTTVTTVAVAGIAYLIYKKRRGRSNINNENPGDKIITESEKQTQNQIQKVISRDETSPEKIIKQSETIRFEGKELKTMSSWNIEVTAKRLAERDINALLLDSDWKNRAEKIIKPTEKLDQESYDLLRERNWSYWMKINGPGDAEQAMKLTAHNIDLMNFAKRYKALKLNTFLDETNPGNLQVARLNDKTFQEFRGNMIETTKEAYKKILTGEVKKAKSEEANLENDQEKFEERLQRDVEEKWHLFRTQAIKKLNYEMKEALEKADKQGDPDKRIDVKDLTGKEVDLEEDMFL